ncbi:MAG: hypothetical protein WDA17_01450 [Sphaerochaetaceae bacterium]|jgi:hypothetical protein
MSLMSHQQKKLEDQFRLLCDDLDHYLEDNFGKLYSLHPNRLKRGKAANVSYDGLFSTGVQFTLGIGSKYGRGYILDITMVTLDSVDENIKNEIESLAAAFVQEKLPLYFPDRKLKVVKDGNIYKLVGDFSLGYLH